MFHVTHYKNDLLIEIGGHQRIQASRENKL